MTEPSRASGTSSSVSLSDKGCMSCGETDSCGETEDDKDDGDEKLEGKRFSYLDIRVFSRVLVESEALDAIEA